MTLKTRITEMLGIEHPIVQGGMVHGLIHDIPSCEELIRRIVDSAEVIIRRRQAGMIS